MAKKGGFDPPITEQLQTFSRGVDNAFSAYINLTKDKLAASSPVDTGRLASSWRIGRNTPDTSVAPILPDGKKIRRPKSPDFPGRITFDGTWYISNSLPYAEVAALGGGGRGPYSGRRNSTAWYTAIQTHTQEDWLRILKRKAANGGLGFPAPSNFRPT